MKYLFLITMMLVLEIELYSYKIHPDAGTTSASFLKIPVGSKASSFGGGYTAVRDDIFGPFYNPASTSLIDNNVFSIFHNIYFAEIKQFVISYGFQPEFSFNNDKDYISFHVNYITYGDFERRSGLYETNPLNPSYIEGRFNASDLLLRFNYSTEFKSFSVGSNINFIFQSVDNEKAKTISFDIGLVKTIDYREKSFDIGFSVMNFGNKIKFIDSSYKLPLVFRAGISTFISGYLFVFDVLKYIDNYPYFVFGAEKKISNIYLRTSYRYRLYGNEHGFWSGFSFGSGLKYKSFDFGYSLNNFGDLGFTHGISLCFKY